MSKRSESDSQVEGGKAVGLRRLIEGGFRVPEFVTIPVGSEGVPDHVRSFLDPSQSYAVRSSSPLEDGVERSFAGQFQTRLGVPGTVEAIAAALAAVLESARSASLEAYGEDAVGAPMAVVVQRMVEAQRSGVAFSRHPVTGLDEVVVESVDGIGDRLADGLVVPDRWVFRWGAFTSRPQGGDDLLAERVARGVREIARTLGYPVDAEWSWDGRELWWLQARRITSIEPVTIYSRRIAKEVMPGIIMPLTWSINVPVVNRAWIRLLDEAVGPTGLQPEQLARRFGCRAYFNMTALGSVFERIGLPRDSLELLLGLDDGPEKPSMRPSSGAVVRSLPRVSAMAWRLLRYPGRVESELEALTAEAAGELPPGDMTDEQLTEGVLRGMRRAERAAYANIVVPLLASLRWGRARRALGRAGVDPHGVDPTAGLPGAGHHDPERSLEPIRRIVEDLSSDRRKWILEATWAEMVAADDLQRLRVEVESYLDRFGALSDRTTDLTSVPWREDPVRVVRMASAPVPQRSVGGVRRTSAPRAVVRAVEAAGRAQILREAVSQAYTRVYMELRPLLLEAGRRLAAAGRLQDAGDIVYLEVGEVLAALQGGGIDPSNVARRSEEIAEAAGYRVPDLIVGDDFVPVPAVDGLTEFSGVGSSPGRHRGRVMVVLDPSSAPMLPPGTVLAVPHSDVSWTPLLAQASAVISEAGGMLSHSSIVAREFGIPCVVSVAGVCDLPAGSDVVVDGYQGLITVLGS